MIPTTTIGAYPKPAYVPISDWFSKPDGDYTSSYVEELAAAIRENHADTRLLFFMTWGREEGDEGNCDYYPLVCTFEGHTRALADGYRVYVDRVGGEINASSSIACPILARSDGVAAMPPPAHL